jgi:hypothetical protein
MRFTRLAPAVLFAIPAVSLLAQTSFTALRGTVTDSSGALVPNAQVTLKNVANAAELTGKTDNSGLYQFPQVTPGTYTITVTAAGFALSTKQAQLLVNQPATINFQVGVQATETVNVSAEAQTLNNTDATIGNALDNQVIEALPSEGRNVPDLLSLQPGVLYLGRQINQDTDSRSGAVAGARSDQGNVTLDGLDDNDQTNGYAFTGVLRSTLDSTQEFRVATTNSNADSGRSSGAQVSLVTKSGTNSMHGDAFEYYRPSFTVANDWFNKQQQLANGLPNVPGKLIRNTFGGSLGGPIKKDKLFYFFNYEGQRTAENVQVTQTVPTAAYKAGTLSYPSGGQTQTLTPAQVAQLDSGCDPAVACPNGPGPNAAALAYFAQYPDANGFATGDGYNIGSYSFSSPAPASLNTSILKLDYQLNDRQHLFVRGNLQKDTRAGTEQFPGQPASSFLTDNTKGIAAGDTWTIGASLINDLRYGYIRQGFSNRGIGKGDYVDFRFMTQATAQTRSTIVNVPVHNVIDNVTWTKGNHTLQGGGNWRYIMNNRATDANSFNNASTNPYWLGGSVPQPDSIGAPPVDGGFANSYLIAYANLIGAVPSVTSVYNYNVANNGQSGTLFPDGALIGRSFRSNEFEWFIQDTWKASPKLTLTLGLRHTILQTPYEIHGQQVSPTIDTHKWFLERGIAAAQGQSVQPDLAFSPSGSHFGKPGYWPNQNKDFAPRFAFAYAPNGKTSLRGGFGIYYDHFGEGIVNSFDQFGSFGLSTSLTNPAGVQTADTSPRFTGVNNLPSIATGTPPPTTAIFPYTPPEGAFLITWGIDNHLKTPYSESFDLSFQRLLPGGFTFEMAYVGRLGRHLMQQLDLAEPTNLVDPNGGGDYFSAGTQLSKIVDANGGDPNAVVQPIKYFEDVFPQLAGNGASATQNIYTNEWAPYRYSLGETTSLADLDFFCVYTCPQGTRFYQSQFSSLYAWSSIGTSSYHAGQFILRHPASHGLQFDFSYTWSKSLDMGSDTQRATEIGSNGAESEILNSWKPKLNKSPSDFDIRHLVTVDAVYKLPFGRGRWLGSGANRFTDAFIGGWQLSGLSRVTSGLPFSVYAPGWATNWQIESYGVQTAPVKIRKHIDANGAPQVFDNPDAINAGVTGPDTPIRLPFPGEAGQRNNFRGDGYFDIDSSLSKTWTLFHENTLGFAWDVFNVTNSVRFDTNGNSKNGLNEQLTSGTLGVYSGTLSAPRVMQFSLRYAF